MTATETNLELLAEPDGKKHKVTVKLGTNALFVDTFSVSSATAREKFANAVIARFEGIDRELLDSRLVALAATSRTRVQAKGTDAEPDRLAGTPQDVLDEANAMLADPELILRIGDDIQSVGLTGERELGLTTYLIGVSRLLPRPLAGIVRGSSSSGKSYTVEKVASLFPPECLVHATQMTPQALFHMKPGSLVHRWVVAGERSRSEDDDRAEATRALREMIASGKLSKLMPTKTGNGIETLTIEQSGPIAFTETTTLTDIFEEDANRCLLLQTDETPEQTRRIIDALGARHAGPHGDSERVIQVHHTLQRMLPRGALVCVPYADRLATAFKCERVEVRRAFPQLLAMVQASALVHYQQRKRGDAAAILADANDYHLARRLISKPFAQSLGGALSKSALDFLMRIPVGENFTAQGLKTSLNLGSSSSVNGWLRELYAAGAVVVVELARGRSPATWRRTDTTLGSHDDLLPSVKSIFP